VNAITKGAFLSDLESLRNRARDQIMKGAVTPSFPEADRLAIVELLNTALATETDCVLRYKRHYFAMESYREMIDFIGPRDPTSRRLLESILAQEEEHAEDLVDLLEDLPKD